VCVCVCVCVCVWLPRDSLRFEENRFWTEKIYLYTRIYYIYIKKESQRKNMWMTI
jgi:hypothetical protein